MALRVCVSASLLAGLCLESAPARADASEEAGQHFEAGVRAFDEQRFGDAASEFERAYDLKPAWQVLYNLGSVYAALGRPVAAVAAFERYREQGGTSVPEARRKEVDAELVRQRAKIALLDITVNAPRAEVRVDAEAVGRSPLSLPVRVAGGTHTVEVFLDGRKPERRDVTVLPQQRIHLDFALVPIVAPAPAAPAPRPSTPPSAKEPPPAVSDTGSGQRIAAYAIGGAGLIGVGIGVVFAVMGQNEHLDAVTTANAGDRPKAESMESDANREKTIGYATLGASGAAALGGIILLMTAPSATVTRAASHLSPWVSPSSGGFSIEGAF